MERRSPSGPASPGAQCRSLANSDQPSVSPSFPANSSTAWWASSTNDSHSCSSRDVPTTRTSRIRPAWNRCSRPGSSLRRDRSPVAPKRTTVVGFADMPPSLPSVPRKEKRVPPPSALAVGHRLVLGRDRVGPLFHLCLVERPVVGGCICGLGLGPGFLVGVPEAGQRERRRAGQRGQHLADVGELGVDAVTALGGGGELTVGVGTDA